MKKKILSMFLALVMITSILTIPANATTLKPSSSTVNAGGMIILITEDLEVYVDGSRVKNVLAQKDTSGDVWIEGYTALTKIFPDETEDKTFPTLFGALLLEDWTEEFGYSMKIKNSAVYLVSDNKDKDDDDDKVVPKPDDDDELEEESFVIYKNGLKFDTLKLYVDDDDEIMIKKSNLKKIFPTEANKLSGSKLVSLEDYAKDWNYKFVLDGSKIYLNNDGNVPVKLYLDKKVVDFPDQQAIIINPGRTMVPVAMVAEKLGFDVTWKPKKDTNIPYDMVIIRNDKHYMSLYLGSNTYYLDGIPYKMDVKPFATNGRTMLPLAFVAQAFGLKIDYSDKDDISVVKLTSK